MVKILVVLRVRMLSDELTNVNNPLMTIVESQPHTKITCVFCRNNINMLHIFCKYTKFFWNLLTF